MNRPLKGRVILIVEDEPLIALQLTLAFEDEGAWVIRARTLKQALAGVEDCKLSAAVLDRALSDGDTSTVCERMTERNIPFIIYSGYDRVDGAARDGVHVKKPVSMPELLAIVQCVITERQMSRHRQEPGVEYAPRRTLHLS
jgi:DNA-binding response OmpR family regulator